VLVESDPYEPVVYNPDPYDPCPSEPGPLEYGPVLVEPGPYDPDPYDPDSYDPCPYVFRLVCRRFRTGRMRLSCNERADLAESNAKSTAAEKIIIVAWIIIVSMDEILRMLVINR